MRILVQEVLSAAVSIEGKTVGAIERGFLLFVGFTAGDDAPLIQRMVDKVLKLRIFPDANGKTNKSLSDVGGNVLSISQFTLYADAKEGNRPSFVQALPPEEARPLYALFNNVLREKIPSLQTGVFGADMKVSLVNDGPFTLWLDSDVLFGKKNG